MTPQGHSDRGNCKRFLHFFLCVCVSAQSSPAEHQDILQPASVHALHLPDGGTNPAGIRLRRYAALTAPLLLVQSQVSD